MNARIPTMHFRYVERKMYDRAGDACLIMRGTERILQQLFDTAKGRVWLDVPCVEEAEDEEE